MNEAQRVWIANEVLVEMHQLARLTFPLETGGMLLGYVADNNEPVITKIIGPGPNAKHGRFKFVPDGAFQQKLLEEYFKKTNGGETYLGDWHTHPKGSAIPSYTDKKTLANIALLASSGISNPIMAILGSGEGSWSLEVIRFLSEDRKFLFRRYLITNLIPMSFDKYTKGCSSVP